MLHCTVEVVCRGYAFVLPRDPCNKSNWHILGEKGVFYEPAKPDGSLSQINIFSQFQKIREELDEIRKGMPTTVEAGIKSGMKGFGFTPTAGEMKRVNPKSKRNNKVSGHQQTIRKAAVPSSPIGVEGDSLATLGDIGGDSGEPNSAVEQQNQFVDAVETILKTNDADDLRGTFKKVNAMRDQQGSVVPSTLFYHKIGGN